jgi:hypothetical protein
VIVKDAAVTPRHLPVCIVLKNSDGKFDAGRSRLVLFSFTCCVVGEFFSRTEVVDVTNFLYRVCV